MVEQTKKLAKEGMEKALAGLGNELKKVRTGRAQVSILDNIKVLYYGTPTPLNQVAKLSTPDAKTFVIAPWEATVLKDIESAIVKSDIGMTPQSDGKIIRLKVPDLTEERRKEFVKNIKKIVEDARVAVRLSRRDANEAVKKGKADKLLSEDEVKRAETEIQKITDEYIGKIDKMGDEKEKELMTL